MKKISLIFSILIFFVSGNSFSQSWQIYASLSGGGITKMVVSPVTGTLFATTTSYNYPVGASAYVYRKFLSSNNLETVNPQTGFAYSVRTVYADYRGYVWLSYWGDPFNTQEGLFLSTNDGSSWTQKYSIGTSNNIFCIALDSANNFLYLGARNGVHRSTNGGSSFSVFNNGLPANTWVRDLEVVSAGLLIASTTNGIFKSTNNGESWNVLPGLMAGDTAGAICIQKNIISDGNDSRLFAGANSGSNLKGYLSDFSYAAIFLSANLTGMGATSIEPSDVIYEFIDTDNSRTAHNCFFLCGFPKSGGNGGIYYSTNDGVLWSSLNTGLTNPIQPSAIAYNKFNGKLYCGFFSNIISGSRIFSMDFKVGIKSVSTIVPENFSLSQNYPNPFNPSTKIRFEIQKASDVKMIVYNSLGKKISTLVNENLNAGTYETDFNGAGYNSGVYFYKLFVSGEKNFIETRKMILTK